MDIRRARRRVRRKGADDYVEAFAQKQFVPDAFVEGMGGSSFWEDAICVNLHAGDAYTGYFIFDHENARALCVRTEKVSCSGGFKGRIWDVATKTRSFRLRPEEACLTSADMRRFYNTEARLFCRLREMIFNGKMHALPWVRSDLKKVQYCIDTRGRYHLYSQVSPYAELFAMSTLFFE